MYIQQYKYYDPAGAEEKEQTDGESHDRGETDKQCDSDSSTDWGDWSYDLDPTLPEDIFPASQPCMKHGVSYTPPGWIRKYRKRVRTAAEKAPVAKKLCLDSEDNY